MKIGIIGTGYISTFHAKAYNAAGAKIVGVTDAVKENFLKKQHIYGNAIFYETPEKLMQDSTIDIIDICTTNASHFDFIMKAADAGKHIFCEKTLTESLEKSLKIRQRLENYSKNFQIGYMKRFFPATNKAIELLPEIGEIHSAYIRSYQPAAHNVDIYELDDWKRRGNKNSKLKDFSGAGMLNMAGSHMLDLMCCLLGKPESVYSKCWGPASYDAEIIANTMFIMQNKFPVHFEACLSPYTGAGFLNDGWDERVEINGKKGKIELYYVTWDKLLENAPLLRVYKEKTRAWTVYTFPKFNPFDEEITRFLEDCMIGRKSVPGINEGYLIDQIIDACYKSNQTNSVVNI